MNFNCEQISGVGKLDFFLLDEITNWPLVVNDTTSAQIIITPEVNDVEGTIDDNSINLDAVPKETPEGIIFNILGTFKFSTRSESIEQLLDQYQNKPGILIADLNTGFRKLYGTNEEPLYMTYRVDEGQKPEDDGAVIVTIKGETRSRPVFYSVTTSE